MPELPEVETTLRQLIQMLPGRTIVSLDQVDWPKMFKTHAPIEMASLLTGEEILAIKRRGKYLVFELTNSKFLVIHRMMSGNLFFKQPKALYDKFTRFVVTFSDQSSLSFVDMRKFGRVYLFLDGAALAKFFVKLGPEPTAENFNFEKFLQLISSRKGLIKPLFLDQSFIAGLGNMYTNEVLFVAKIHPTRKVETLSLEDKEALYDAIHQILDQAISNKGTTLSSYMDGGQQKGRNTHLLNVHMKNDKPCPVCSHLIAKSVIDQRSSYFCPNCQL